MRHMQGAIHISCQRHMWSLVLLSGEPGSFFDHTSLILTCQCIRSYLDEMKKKCPACDAQISEASIRRNRALEDITDAWEAARYAVSVKYSSR